MADVIQLKGTPPADKIWEKIPGYPYLRRNRSSGTIYVRYYKAGRGHLERSTGFDTVGKANARAMEMIAEFIGEKRKAPGRRMTAAAVLDELLETLKHETDIGKRRPRTFENDTFMVPRLKGYFGNRFIDELDEDWWQSWSEEFQRNVRKARMRGEKPKRTTLFDIAKYLNKLTTFAERRKYIVRRPRFSNPDPATPQTTPKIYSPEELARLKANIDPAVLLAYVLAEECCFRLTEAICLQWDMVTFGTDENRNATAVVRLPAWLVKTGSTTGEGREVEVSDMACYLLREAERKRDPKSPFVFPSPKDLTRPIARMTMWRRFRDAKAKAGITGKAWFHHLRATFYTRKLLEERKDVTSVSAYGGTSIVTLQKRYLRADAQRTRHVVKG